MNRLLRKNVLPVLLLFASGADALADESDRASGWLAEHRVTAWLRSDYFQSSAALDNEGEFLGETLQVKALPQLSDSVDLKLEVRAEAPDLRRRPGYRGQVELLEGYVARHFGRLDLRVGKQVVAWGRADGINPTDNLTPKNYRVLLPYEEDQRFGIWAARLDLYLTDALTLTVFASPDFEPDRFALPGDGGGFEAKMPEHSLDNLETGIKLNKTSDDFDWSLSYYHGFSLLPTVVSSLPAIGLRYDRIDVLGADCAKNFGRFAFRSEIAYSAPSDRVSLDPNARQRRLFWVSGVDRTFMSTLNVNVQLFVRWMPDYARPDGRPDPVVRRVASINAGIDGQQAEVSTGYTFRVSDTWFNDTLRAELFAIENLKRGDRYFRPLLSYDANDHLRLSFGANIYRGNRTAQYGLLRADQGVFAELRFAL